MSNCLDHVSSAKVDEALAACVQCVAAWSNLMFFYCDSVVFRTFFSDEELAHMFREACVPPSVFRPKVPLPASAHLQLSVRPV